MRALTVFQTYETYVSIRLVGSGKLSGLVSVSKMLVCPFAIDLQSPGNFARV